MKDRFDSGLFFFFFFFFHHQRSLFYYTSRASRLGSYRKRAYRGVCWIIRLVRELDSIARHSDPGSFGLVQLTQSQ